MICPGFFLACALGLSLPARAGLSGYWNFNDNALDQSGNGLAGTLVGAPVYDASVPPVLGTGKSIRFDGANDYVSLGNPPSLDFGKESFSFGGWLKTTQPWVTGDQGKGTLFSNGGDQSGGIRYTLTHNEGGSGNEGRLDFVLDDNAIKSSLRSVATTLLNDGAWHHIVGVRDGTEQFLYVDGVLSATATLPANYDLSGTSQKDALIGAAWSQQNNLIFKMLEGNVDDVFVWRGVLSSNQIAALAAGTDTPYTLFQKSPPEVKNLVPANGAIAHPAANGIQFDVRGFNLIPDNGIQLFLNDVDVTGSLVLSPVGTNRHVTFSGLQSGGFYSGRIIVADTFGASSTNDFNFDTLGEGGVLIEVEDCNYGLDAVNNPVIGVCLSGQEPPPVTSGGGFQDNPPPSGFDPFFAQVNGNGVGYLYLTAVPEVDYHDASTAVGIGVNDYRLCVPGATRTTGDYTRSKYTDLNLAAFDLEVHQIAAGDWMNYTRTFPASNYVVYLRVMASTARKFQLGLVTNPKSPAQTEQGLGEFNVPAGTDYGYVPLTDLTGEVLVRPFSGVKTVRLTALDADNDAFPNFIVFLPTTNAVTALGPEVINRTPDVNATVARNTTISATIRNRDLSVDVPSIQLHLDGVPVLATVTPTGTGATIAYSPIPFARGSVHSVAVIYSDTLGSAYTNEWSFDIIPPGYFIQDDGPEKLAVFEAEHFLTNGIDLPFGYPEERWVFSTDRANYSGTGYMWIPNANHNGDYSGNPPLGPVMGYAVEFVTSGVHYLWVRGDTETINSGSDDSLIPGVDGVADGEGNQRAITSLQTATGDFEWVNSRMDAKDGDNRFRLTIPSPGIHIINIWAREDGAFADKFLLTTDPDYNPNDVNGGFGPPESSAEGSPRVAFITPTDGQTFTANLDINLSAQVVSSDSPIAKVEFFSGTDKVGEDNASPYSAVLTNVPDGIYALRVVATDVNGQSGAKTITINVGDVVSPTVSITSPGDGETFAVGANVSVEATATDNVNVARVEFFVRGEKVSEDTSSPYSLALNSLAQGVYHLMARATDDVGNSTDSAVVTITVGTPPPTLFIVANPASLNASDTGVRYRLESLGYSVVVVEDLLSQTTDADGKALVIISSTVGSGDVLAKFTASPVPVITWEQALQDDLLTSTNNAGVGGQTTVEITGSGHPLTGGLPAGVYTVATEAGGYLAGEPNANAGIGATLAGDTRATIYGYDTGAVLIDGVTTAPARRVAFFMNDDAFAALTVVGRALFDAAVGWAVNHPMPTVSVTSPTPGQEFMAGDDVTVDAVATSAAKVEFFLNDVLMGEDAEAPYSLVIPGAPTGTNTVTARVTAADGYQAVAPVDIVVAPGVLVPLVAEFDSGSGNLTISWTGAGQLQATPDLTPPVTWTNVTGVVGTSYTAPVSGSSRLFYRLAQ